jgi:hypothetical protein
VDSHGLLNTLFEGDMFPKSSDYRNISPSVNENVKEKPELWPTVLSKLDGLVYSMEPGY